MKKLALVLALAALGLAAAAASSRMEKGPEFQPWIDPLPEYAVAEGYQRYRDSEGGYAMKGWAEFWMRQDPPAGDGPVIIDKRHASKQPETARLDMHDYSYTEMHGFARAFQPLGQAGVPTRQLWEPYTARALGGASAVFINLVSGDNPGFTWSEVKALTAFVRQGGGLVLITDHTDCYFHAEMLQPLTQELGFEVVPATATHKGPGNTLSPRSVAWARVFPRQVSHPVTRGVRLAGWMTGGILRPGPDYQGLVGTGERGWEDRLDPYKKPKSAGFTGNLKQDEDEPGGPQDTVIAGTYGKGRVVVLADQNAWGATLIGYEDNSQLFTNALSWATGVMLPLELRGPRSVTTIGGPRSLCSTVSEFGYRTLQVSSQRLSEAALVPEFCTEQGEVRSESLLLLPEAQRADLPQLLDQARRVVALVDPEHTGSRQLLELLDLAWTPAGEPAEHLRWLEELPAVDHRIFEEAPTLEPVQPRPVGLTGEGLQVLAEDSLGRPVILRHMRGDTELLLVLDAALLTNANLGLERERPWLWEDYPERSAAMPASQRVAFRLLGRLYDI